MIELFKSKEQEKEFISEYANPFMSDKVKSIYFFIIKSDFNGSVSIFADVKFQNGKSSGEQRIDATNFVDLVKNVELFIKSL